MTNQIAPYPKSLQTRHDNLLAALQSIIHDTCNCPCMSRAAQDGFGRNQAEDEYRQELNALILGIRNIAKQAINDNEK